MRMSVPRARLASMEWLGVDVGWVFPAADSDGNVYRWNLRNRAPYPIAQAGPVTIRTPDGKVRTQPPLSQQDAAQALARADVDKRHVRRVAWQIVALAQRTKRGIALEDWSGFARRKKAWMRVRKEIEATARSRGVKVTQVNRAYTSLTCPECGYKDRANRATRSTFRCQRCGFEQHADVVAAMNIAAKASGMFAIAPRDCENPACPDGVLWKAGLCSFCYWHRYRWGRLPDTFIFERRGQERVKAKPWSVPLTGPTARGLSERAMESWRTHDAWGNPIESHG
jgi:predicted RNA-binding Zn-ribbon protein involved in translation (DUF1610 family)